MEKQNVDSGRQGGKEIQDAAKTVTAAKKEKVMKGHCRKCGERIGRGLFFHEKYCEG